MPEMVADFLEALARLEEMPGTGVPQAVRTAPFSWPLVFEKVLHDEGVEAARRQRPVWSQQPQEHEPA